jgi:excisionase family DNA binding protein
MNAAETQERPLAHCREEAAARIGISLRKLDELIASKEIPSLKIGKRRLVSEAALVSFVKKSENKSR